MLIFEPIPHHQRGRPHSGVGSRAQESARALNWFALVLSPEGHPLVACLWWASLIWSHTLTLIRNAIHTAAAAAAAAFHGRLHGKLMGPKTRPMSSHRATNESSSGPIAEPLYAARARYHLSRSFVCVCVCLSLSVQQTSINILVGVAN